MPGVRGVWHEPLQQMQRQRLQPLHVMRGVRVLIGVLWGHAVPGSLQTSCQLSVSSACKLDMSSLILPVRSKAFARLQQRGRQRNLQAGRMTSQLPAAGAGVPDTACPWGQASSVLSSLLLKAL